MIAEPKEIATESSADTAAARMRQLRGRGASLHQLRGREPIPRAAGRKYPAEAAALLEAGVALLPLTHMGEMELSRHFRGGSVFRTRAVC